MRVQRRNKGLDLTRDNTYCIGITFKWSDILAIQRTLIYYLSYYMESHWKVNLRVGYITSIAYFGGQPHCGRATGHVGIGALENLTLTRRHTMKPLANLTTSSEHAKMLRNCHWRKSRGSEWIMFIYISEHSLYNTSLFGFHTPSPKEVLTNTIKVISS